MMKKYIFLFSMFLSMVLASCAVSKSVISQGTDLAKYKYVTVIDNDTYRERLTFISPTHYQHLTKSLYSYDTE